jgi:hypothetical protein
MGYFLSQRQRFPITPFKALTRLPLSPSYALFMGLDSVEIVLRTEELFDTTIEDDESAAVRTVGEFYNLICTKLNVVPLRSPVSSLTLPSITEKEKSLLFFYKSKPLPAPPEVLPWSPQSVWDCLVALLVDQLCLEPKEIEYHARLVEDLGVD